MWRVFIFIPIIIGVYLFAHSKIEDFTFTNAYENGPLMDKYFAKPFELSGGVFDPHADYFVAGRVDSFRDNVLVLKWGFDKYTAELYVLSIEELDIQPGDKILISGIVGDYYKENKKLRSSLKLNGPNIFFLESFKKI